MYILRKEYIYTKRNIYIYIEGEREGEGKTEGDRERERERERERGRERDIFERLCGMLYIDSSFIYHLSPVFKVFVLLNTCIHYVYIYIHLHSCTV